MQMRAPVAEPRPTSDYDLPDATGHFGPYGGTFVPETLVDALQQLTAEYNKAKKDAAAEAPPKEAAPPKDAPPKDPAPKDPAPPKDGGDGATPTAPKRAR